MGIHYSPAVVQDGLVFYYDMGNAQKSWKGEPTTNLYTGSVDLAGTVDGFGGGSFLDTNLVSSNPFDTGIVYARKSNSGVATWSVEANLTAGITYTYSIWCKTITQTSVSLRRNEPGVYVVESKSVTVAEGRWTRVDFTFTVNTGKSGTQVVGINVGDANVGQPNPGIFIYGAQLEQKSYATPFVNGTRSNTQAILDLTNNYTVTANSATYNSNNTFSFNGTTNKLTINNGINYSNGFTINSWIYPLSAGENSRGTIVAKNNDINNGNGFSLRFADGPRLLFSIYLSGAIFTDVSSIPYNAWTNVCITVSPSGSVIAAFYLNGNQTNTDSSSYALANITTSNLLSIGAIGSTATTDYVFDGTISVVQIYQRPLSALEVEQNFSALRGRYGV